MTKVKDLLNFSKWFDASTALWWGRKFSVLVLLLSFNTVIISCSGGGSDFNSLGVIPQGPTDCTVTNSSPTFGALKVSAGLGALTNITVGLSNATCSVKFALNGVDLTATGTTLSLNSDLLATSGPNILTVTTGSSVKTWNLTKNHPPVCGVAPSPPISGTSMGAGASLTLTNSASDPDADALSFIWKVNSTVVGSTILSAVSSAGSSVAVFTPTVANLGTNAVTMLVSDGIDSTNCDWAIDVNGACTISSPIPSTASPVKISATSTSNALFQASATTGCGYNWKLNNATVAGQTSSSFALDPASLSPGNNTLTVTVGNGSSSDTKSWTVVRNIAPTCGAQVPSSTGNNVGVGGHIDLDATGSDLNGDLLTFNWTINGASVGSQFVVTGTSTTTHAVFTPDSTNSGTNTVKAVITDGLDSAACSWTVQTLPVCSMISSSPSSSTLKVSANPGASQTYVATPNDSSCAMTWSLNGTPIAGVTGPVATVISSQLASGPSTNTLVATAANSNSSATRTWTITKNQAPICNSQTPALSGNNVGAGGTITFDAVAGNPDSDSLTYAWTYNGSVASPSYFTFSSSGNSAEAIFAPTNAQIGNNQTVSVAISDGLDNASCNWNVNVLNACVISGTTPLNPGPVKVPNVGTATTSFQAAANSGCNYSWSLNGSPISGANSNGYLLPSSSLSAGNNTLLVSVTNGISTDTKAWTVIKNTPSTCASLVPATTGNVGVGGTINFQLNAGNTDSDNLTYSWLYNGAAANPSFFIPTAFGNSAQLAFTPDSSFVGSNQAVSVAINDGYDTTSCAFTVNIVNSCTISSTVPSTGAAVRVANASSATKLFSASANSGCNYSWTLNGIAISGAIAGNYTVPSTDLTPGNNTLVVSVTNGSSTDTKTWTVVKNTPPQCSSQVPATAAQNIAVGGAITLTANGSDGNTDPLTFTWKDNGSATGSQFAITGSTGTSQAIFTPDATNIGSNSVQAVISDSYDSVNCAWTVQVAPSCQISSSSPSTGSLKVAALGTTSSPFSAVPSDASCNMSWALNGSAIGGATGPSVSVLSSALSAAPSTNTLVATATNGSSTATRTWTVSKNQAPICNSQTPNATGNSVTSGSTITFNSVAGNPDADVLTYNWTYNGSAVGGLFATSSSGNNTQAIFSPNSSVIGNSQAVSVAISDGYDSASCGWTVNVVPPCQISSPTPSATSLKVAAAGATSSSFSVGGTSGCAFSWTLNGSTIGGATANNYSVLSSALSAGANTLLVTLTDGVSTDTRSWTVNKNAVPTCSTQNPAATGNSVGVGGSITLQSNAGNTDSDPLTYAWTYNGTAVNASYFSVSSFGNSAQAIFNPDSSFIGASQNVAVAINDGLDTASCTWNLNIQNSCTISTQTPSSGSSVRVPYLGTAASLFQASANPGCNFSWKVNGSTVGGATSSSYNVLSSDLSPGNNTLTVSVTNGTTTDTKTWNVVRNSPPTCSSQTPTSTPTVNSAVGVAKTFVANGSDPNTDPLTFTWTLNGAAAGSQFAVTPGTNTSTAVFTPDGTSVGTNNLVAQISDGYDTVNCSWTEQVLPACQILAGSSPATATPKVPNLSSSNSTFTAVANDSSCTTSWALNGSSLGITSAIANLTSSQFATAPTTNTLVATVTNTYTTATRTWTVTKNTPPTCSSQTPASTGGSVGVGGTITLASVAGNTDSDPLTYAWTYNGSAVNPTYFTVSSSGNNSQAIFAPNASYVGSGQSVAVAINDGYDTASCSWNLNVANACVISAVAPATASTVKMAQAGSYSSTFTASTNAGCNFAWTLNGSTIGGQTSGTLNLTSALLNSGSNTLQVTASNGTSTDTKTWTVQKNTAPFCSGQTPGSSGNTVAIGETKNFSTSGVDPNGDALTFTWFNNGNPVGSQFAVTTGATTSQVALTPDAPLVGANTIRVDINDGLDTTSCTWSATVKAPCTIGSASPSTATVKMPFNATSTLTYGAPVNDSNCALSWKLNGSVISGEINPIYTLASNSLTAAPAANTLVATATDGYTTATHTWTITKNVIPTCSSQTPAATGNSVSVGGNTTFATTAGNTDSDTLTYSWIYNGAPVNATYFTVTSGGNNSQAVFNPSAAYVGTGQSLGVTISDSYDTASCSWSVNVVNTCSISSASPSTSTVKVANLGTTSTAFYGIPSDSSCASSWTLNGSPFSTNQIININSSAFTAGPATNTLTLTLNNGVSTPTTRTWTVTKNRVPQCSAQTPVTAPAAMIYTTSRNFSGTSYDPDSDPLSGYSWLYNGAAAPSLFSAVSTSSGISTSTFQPTFSQIGTAQNVAIQFTDGYDTASCAWNFDITNPNVVSITSCNPAANPVVVYSTGGASTQTLQVIAANATAGGYSWYKNGSIVGGATSSSYAVSSGSLPAGTYTYRGVASDAQGNTAYCDYNVKVNAAPVISAITPTNSQTYRMNYSTTIAFSVTASDANSDTLTYAWTMDGITNAALGNGTASVILNPNSTLSLIGSHTIAVTVSDGYESISRSWTVEINLFNQACNSLYNSNSSGGQICTLVGVPGMGQGLIPSADQNQLRIQPAFVVDDGAGNWIFSDNLNHTVNFYNRSGSSITRWGLTMPAGTMTVVLGNGASGITIDGLYNRQFKLDTPQGVAYDSVTKNLFVSDYNNHRVAMMDNTGLVATVISSSAGGGVTNNLAGNTDGSAGTSATCNNPTGLDLVNYGGNRYLYVTCYSSHTIKRMDVLPGSANQNKIYTVVGRLNTSNASFAGNTDGTLGTTGLATTNGPWSITDDGNGNIYWVEWSGLRLRVATLAGSQINFFQGATPVPGNALNIIATDTTSVLTAGSATTWPTLPVATPTKFVISGPTSMIPGTCGAYRLQAQTSGSQYANVASTTVGTMTGNGAGTFYTDAGCTSSAGGSITIANGTAETPFYFKTATTATYTLGVTGTLTTSSLVVSVGAVSTATKLAVFVPPNYAPTLCQPFTVQLQNASSLISTYGTARVISLSNSAFGNFFTNSGCTTLTNTLTIAAGQSEVTGYFASTTIAQANQVTSILGSTTNNNINVTTTTSVNAGLVTLRQTRGLAVTTSAGSVTGFFIGAYDQHRIVWANNTGSTATIGGTTVGPSQVGQVVGTGTAGFNSDGLGNTSRTNVIYGLGLSYDQTKLMFGDFSNARLRYLDLTIGNGYVTTELGNGRLRAGNLGDSLTAANAMYLNGPTNMVMDDANRKLYISDSINSRIRRVDMLTGWVDTMIGKGAGAGSVEPEDPTNVLMNTPRGLALMTSGGANFLVYADQQASTAINQDCQIRALNLTPNIGSPPAVNLLGTAVPAFKVATVIGDYTLGCNPLGAQPANTALGTGTGVKLYNTEGISSDGTNLYHASYNDHCILKTTPSGATSVVVGTCGTAGTTDGSTSTALIRYPIAVVVDPSYAADGNFFFADAPDLNPTRIRYVNFRNTSVTIGNFTVPAASPPYAQVTTLWTIAMSNGGRVYGLAAFGPQFCIAGGYPTSGSFGTHNVTCYDRSTSLAPVTLRVGPNEASSPAFRAGAPLSNIEQEGIAATSAFMSAPYGITFDNAGNLYIPERNNHIIRMVRRWWP